MVATLAEPASGASAEGEAAGTEIVWNEAREADWRQALSAAGRSSIEQSWAYGEACAAFGFAVERGLIVRNGETAGLVQVATRRFFGAATVGQIVRGPLWLGEAPSLDAQRPVLAHLKRRATRGALHFLYWVPELPDTPAGREAMRRTGLRRVMTGHSSAWLDLAPDEDALRAGLDGKWRNQLRKGEAAKLRVRVTHSGEDFDDLLARHDEHRRRRRFRGPRGLFIRAIAAGTATRSDIVVVAARQDRALAAGVLFVRHGASATYYAGWSSADARRVCAHNVLLWRGLCHLKKAGVRWLDVGGLDTTTAPGVARFKLGLGGEAFTLAGSYL